MKNVLLSFVFLSCSTVFAGTASVNQAYERLKNIGVDLQPTGTICEYLAKETLEKKYSPEQFRVVIGVQYGETTDAMGELDLTVVDLEYDEVVYVGEVKCWKDPRAGLKKAKEQLARFKGAQHSSRVNWMKILAPGYSDLQITSRHYDSNFETGYVAQKGSRKSGYTSELDFTLSEAMEIRARIRACQSSGECRVLNKRKKRS